MMKHVRKNLFVVLVIAAVCFILSPTAHAGSLNPPGVPGSTMKPLDEVEPRIAINANQYAGRFNGNVYNFFCRARIT